MEKEEAQKIVDSMTPDEMKKVLQRAITEAIDEGAVNLPDAALYRIGIRNDKDIGKVFQEMLETGVIVVEKGGEKIR